jgi:hypothetical protein
MTSKRSAAWRALSTWKEIGCVETSESSANGRASVATKSRHMPHAGTRSAVAFQPTNVANDSFSQRSFHHAIVTRSPHHMWVSSCAAV